MGTLRTWIAAFGLALCLSAGGPVARADTPDENPLDLAALMIQDGKLDRAITVLDGIDRTVKDFDTSRYWTLRGLVWLRQGIYDEAATSFENAIKTAIPPIDPQLTLSLARARVLSDDNEGALAALAAGGDAVKAFAGAFLVKARAERNLEDYPAAWSTLEEGAGAFPSQGDFPRQQVLLLVTMGLTREAGERASTLLDRADASADDALTIAEALRQAGYTERAVVILEEARVRYPSDDRLGVRLAAAHVDADRPLAAARLLQIAAHTDPTLADESAELFRRAGQLEAAFMMNAVVPDPIEKARQRFGLLLEAGSFDRAVALESRLSRLGLMDDDRIRYGVAYAWFQVGDYDRADALLRGINDSTIFAQATELRRAMQAEEEGE